MAAGDLLFYKSDGVSIFDKSIAVYNAIRGIPPYVHVAIDYDGIYKIEMLGQGCCHTEIVQDSVAARFEFPHDSIFDSSKFNDALSWLYKQIGQPYGWDNIAASLDTSHTYFFLQTTHYDCSNLAASFLYRAGYNIIKIKGKDYVIKPLGAEPDFSNVTPGSLAQFLHVE